MRAPWAPDLSRWARSRIRSGIRATSHDEGHALTAHALQSDDAPLNRILAILGLLRLVGVGGAGSVFAGRRGKSARGRLGQAHLHERATTGWLDYLPAIARQGAGLGRGRDGAAGIVAGDAGATRRSTSDPGCSAVSTLVRAATTDGTAILRCGSTNSRGPAGAMETGLGVRGTAAAQHCWAESKDCDCARPEIIELVGIHDASRGMWPSTGVEGESEWIPAGFYVGGGGSTTHDQ
jgi:hypothetical protein